MPYVVQSKQSFPPIKDAGTKDTSAIENSIKADVSTEGAAILPEKSKSLSDIIDSISVPTNPGAEQLYKSLVKIAGGENFPMHIRIAACDSLVGVDKTPTVELAKLLSKDKSPEIQAFAGILSGVPTKEQLELMRGFAEKVSTPKGSVVTCNHNDLTLNIVEFVGNECFRALIRLDDPWVIDDLKKRFTDIAEKKHVLGAHLGFVQDTSLSSSYEIAGILSDLLSVGTSPNLRNYAVSLALGDNPPKQTDYVYFNILAPALLKESQAIRDKWIEQKKINSSDPYLSFDYIKTYLNIVGDLPSKEDLGVLKNAFNREEYFEDQFKKEKDRELDYLQRHCLGQLDVTAFGASKSALSEFLGRRQEILEHYKARYQARRIEAAFALLAYDGTPEVDKKRAESFLLEAIDQKHPSGDVVANIEQHLKTGDIKVANIVDKILSLQAADSIINEGRQIFGSTSYQTDRLKECIFRVARIFPNHPRALTINRVDPIFITGIELSPYYNGGNLFNQNGEVEDSYFIYGKNEISWFAVRDMTDFLKRNLP